MYCIIKCIVRGKQARVKNGDLRHPSRAVVMKKKRKFCVTRPQRVKRTDCFMIQHAMQRYKLSYSCKLLSKTSLMDSTSSLKLDGICYMM